MKVVHLTVLRNLVGGQRKQLQQERIAASALQGVQWDTIAIHDGDPQSEFERRTPALFRRQILRYIYSWFVAYQLSRQYDLLLMRHAPFDLPGAFFSRFIKNRVSIHHCREIEELPLIRPGLLGKVLSVVERAFGGQIIRNTRAVLGVTREVAEYEVQRAKCPDKPRYIYPNTISTRLVELLPDERERSIVHAAFICGQFTAWHGLDILVDGLAKEAQTYAGKLRIHLIGNLSNEQRKSVIEVGSGIFEIHGHMTEEQYRRIVSRCDVGIGSLALFRQFMTESSTLKMCEMLAMGLPVYSGDPDVVLPEGFTYCKVDRSPSIAELYEFGLQMKRCSREEVRMAAQPFIEKEVWVLRASDFLRKIHPKT
jgi:glycosyltransferase involved in cell wall biosynthesis